MELEQRAKLIKIIVRLFIILFFALPFFKYKSKNPSNLLVSIIVYLLISVFSIFYKQKRKDKSEDDIETLKVGSMFGYGFLVLAIGFLVVSNFVFLRGEPLSSFSLIIILGILFTILGAILLYLSKWKLAQEV